MRSVLIPLIVSTLSTTAYAADPSVVYQKSYDLEAKLDYPQALAALDALPSSEKSSYTAHLRRAWLLYLSARYEEAVADYEKAIAREPKAVEPLLGLSLPQMALRRWLDAEKTLGQALRIDPNNYLGNSRLAFTLFNLGRYAPAEAAYRRILAMYPSDIEMQTGLGYALLRQGKNDEAQKVFSRVLEVAPRHVPAADGLRASKLQL